jgi:hypothetical protein
MCNPLVTLVTLPLCYRPVQLHLISFHNRNKRHIRHFRRRTRGWLCAFVAAGSIVPACHLVAQNVDLSVA